MTTIHNLPKEILIRIFEELWPSPTECQYVCRNWYTLAHKVVLKNLLIPFHNVQRFISSIDSNPDPAYLNAVERLDIEFDEAQEECLLIEQYFDKEMIEKLFYRFPNLNGVELDGSSDAFSGFNDEVCKTILKKCRKLDTFEVHIKYELHDSSGRYIYYRQRDMIESALHNVRLLLTEIHFDYDGFTWGPDDHGDFISKFPRLKAIRSMPGLNKFQILLPAFEQLSNLATIEMEDVLDDQEGFAETYLTTKTNDEQERILHNISKVKYLYVDYEDLFGMNSLKFITTYFTGLDCFWITGELEDEDSANLPQSFVFNTIFDLVCAAKNVGWATFYSVPLEDISRHFPFIVSKLCSEKPSTCKSRILKVEMEADPPKDGEYVHLGIELNSTNSLRVITITVPSQVTLHEIVTIISSANNYDNFLLEFGDLFKYNRGTSTSLYDEILTELPFLKEVALEIPPTYEQDSSPIVYPLIERPSLRINAGDKSQAVLDEFRTKFPNLKQLNIWYFCGKWNKDQHEYQILLPEYSLERLALDLTAIKTEMGKNQQKKFIVVQVSVTSSNKQHLFKISWVNCTPTKNRISENDLTTDNDYYRVHVTANNLQRLDIYLVFLNQLANPNYARSVKSKKPLTLFNNI